MLQRILGAFLALLFLAAVVVFATIAAGILLAAGLLVGAWAWWRGRARPGGIVIEGEFRDETELQPQQDRPGELNRR